MAWDAVSFTETGEVVGEGTVSDVQFDIDVGDAVSFTELGKVMLDDEIAEEEFDELAWDDVSFTETGDTIAQVEFGDMACGTFSLTGSGKGVGGGTNAVKFNCIVGDAVSLSSVGRKQGDGDFVGGGMVEDIAEVEFDNMVGDAV